MTNKQIAVLRFGARRAAPGLAALPCHEIAAGADVETAIEGVRRVVVLGDDADLAMVLTRLMRLDRLDIEVAPTPGLLGARRARSAAAQRVPLIRDDTGTAVVGSALWLPPDGAGVLYGEAVIDDDVLFDGEVSGVRIEPTLAMPGLRAAVVSGGMGPRRWRSGRAAQLGTTGARVVLDGVPAPREVTRSTLYRHTTGWLRVG